ncbi:MAG: glycosyltransferase family 39 protein [Paludibacteraceae bacterium]|nr:glycosyltransferase family 39 protein [Paludibacteraceae bacterium]
MRSFLFSMQRQTYNNLLFLSILLTGAIIFGFQLHYALCYAPVYCDSGYYLAIAQQANLGHHLYSDIVCGYPPLWIYLIAGILRLFPNAPYEFWLCFQALVTLATATIAGLLTWQQSHSRTAASLSGWLFACSTFGLGGEALLLEIPSLGFGLLSAYLIFQERKSWEHLLLAGIAAACSAATKQYGAGFILLNGALLLVTSRRKLRDTLIFIAGVALPLIVLAGINPAIVQTLQTGYGTSSHADNVYQDQPLLRYIPEAARLLFLSLLPSLFFLLYIPFYKNIAQAVLLLWCIGGILGFLGQFYFNNGDHYYLYLMGFGAIAIGCMAAYCKHTHWIPAAIYLMLTIYTLSCLRTRYKEWWWYRPGDKARETALTQTICDYTTEDDRLQIFNAEDIGQYFLTRRTPPVINGKISYSFGALALTDELVSYRIRHTDYILKRKDLEWEFKVCDSIQNLLSQCDTLYSDDRLDLLSTRH